MKLFLVVFTLLLAFSNVPAQRGEFPVFGKEKEQQASLFDQQISFFGGATTVHLSSDLVGALGALEIGVRQVNNLPIVRGRVSFPITDGTLDNATLRGEILHSNGLVFSRGGSAVKIQSFIIDTTGEGAIITGLASANGSVVGRIPLFDLDLSGAGIRVRGVTLQITNVGVTLRPEAAGALNAVFETTAFEAGFPIGTATVAGLAFGT